MIYILVSGTRRATWAHRRIVSDAIKNALGRRWADATLRHGDAPGVDRYAAYLAESWGWTVEPLPAEWDRCDLTVPRELGGCPDGPHRRQRPDGTTYCPHAGHRRNQRLVDLQPDADHVLVFPATSIKLRSGTRDLYRRARRAGLHVHDPIPLEVANGR